MKLEGARAVAFDLDGTLVHSKIDFPKMKKRIVEIFRSRGVEQGALPPKGTTFDIIGEGIRQLRQKGVSEDISEVMRLVTETLNSIELEGVEETVAIGGIRPALEGLRRRGLRIGVLTRGCREYAIRSLRVVGLHDLIDQVVGRDEVPNPKPHPDHLFLLAERLGVETERLIMVGDHLMDFECARRAGVSFIGVLTGSSDLDTFRDAGVENVLATAADLPDLI